MVNLRAHINDTGGLRKIIGGYWKSRFMDFYRHVVKNCNIWCCDIWIFGSFLFLYLDLLQVNDRVYAEKGPEVRACSKEREKHESKT